MEAAICGRWLASGVPGIENGSGTLAYVFRGGMVERNGRLLCLVLRVGCEAECDHAPLAAIAEAGEGVGRTSSLLEVLMPAHE